MEIKNLKLVELDSTELVNIEAGGFWEAAYVVVKTVTKYSSLTGALVVGIGDGAIEAAREHNE